MTNTPNHNYSTPSEGTTNWHIPLNENFEQLDIDVEIRGLEEQMGEYEPKAGTKYEATDSGAVYYGNGDTWILSDRKLDQLDAEAVFTKQLQKNGPRIVSPSISQGYNSLQSAIDDSIERGSREIWLTEDIQENIYIPTVGVDWSDNPGLAIRGVSGPKTVIKDNQQDGTPVIHLEEGGDMAGLLLEDLHVKHNDFADTRAFSFSPNEEGFDRGSTMSHTTIKNCRFTAPCVIGQSFFTYVENTTFRPFVEMEYYTNGVNIDETITTSATIVRGGNQHAFNRCNFVTKTGSTKYGALWIAAARTQAYYMCHFNMGLNPGCGDDDDPDCFYDINADRPVGAILVDGSGDLSFETAYCETPGDFAVVTDKQITDRSTSGLIFTNPRLHSIKIENIVNGLAINGPQLNIEINVETGFAASGSYVREAVNSVDVVGGNERRFLRVFRKSPIGWDTTTPPVPTQAGKDGERRNNNTHPVRIYQSGAEGTRIIDSHGNDRLIPDGSSPTVLGQNEFIYFETSPPSDWEWYGME